MSANMEGCLLIKMVQSKPDQICYVKLHHLMHDPSVLSLGDLTLIFLVHPFTCKEINLHSEILFRFVQLASLKLQF